MLCELIAHRYEIKSLLITFNHPFSAWDEIFADFTMTVAAVERLVHHSLILEIQAEYSASKLLCNSHLPLASSGQHNCRHPARIVDI